MKLHYTFITYWNITTEHTHTQESIIQYAVSGPGCHEVLTGDTASEFQKWKLYTTL